MIRRILGSKLFVLFISLIIVGFFIGLSFTIITSKSADSYPVKTSGQIKDAPGIK